VAELLRQSSAAGQISVETLSRRLDLAYDARSREQLGELVSDVRPRRRWLTSLVEGASALAAEAEAAWRRPRIERLALPPAGRDRVTIGRAPGSDCLLSDPSVSRRHAELRADGEGWVLVDVGSTNGTRLNGWRLTGPAGVRAGDEVVFGDARFRLGRPA
jgi:FHA domain/Domain of unknown function (DUF1707)